MAKKSLTQDGIINNKGSKAATFTNTKTGKTSYVDSTYVPRTPKTPAAPGATSSGGGAATTPTTPAPGAATGPSEALKAMSIANSPKPDEAPVTEAPKGVESPYYSRQTSSAAEKYLAGGAFKEPEDADDIQRRMLKDAQAEINSINEYGNTLIQEQQTMNQSRSNETRGVNALTGLSGSDEANANVKRTDTQNKADVDRVRAGIQVKVESVLADIRKSAIEEARQQREDARLGAQASIEFQEAQRLKASENATLLAQSGATIEGFQKTDPEAYAILAKNVGGEATLKAMFTLNRPVDQIVDKTLEGGKYVIAFQNPLDGKIRVETVDTGLPVGYSKTIDAGNRILAVPDNWGGDPADLVTINKGLTPGQAAAAAAADGGSVGDNPQLYSGLNAKTATAVRSKVGAFKSEPTVQNFAVVQEGHNFAQSIDTKTQNPADDQALIYSLAKALDPGSVVREGEYATAQKYAQSWISAYGKGVEQALLGTGFLSETARDNIKTVIGQKYQASRRSYDNLYRQYGSGIDSLTGRSDGSKFLIDYATPDNSSSSATLRSPDGTQEVDTADLTPEELEEARDAGWQ